MTDGGANGCCVHTRSRQVVGLVFHTSKPTFPPPSAFFVSPRKTSRGHPSDTISLEGSPRDSGAHTAGCSLWERLTAAIPGGLGRDLERHLSGVVASCPGDLPLSWSE